MNLLNKENVEDVDLNIDQLQFVINNMFPNIIGGYHWLGEGQCGSDFTHIPPSRIIGWNCEHTKPSAEELLEAWQVLRSKYDQNIPDPVTPEQPTRLSIQDLQNL